MGITEIAIKNNRVTILVLVVLLISGFGSFTQLPRAEDPGFIIRTAVVTTQFPGASPQRMEELVTDRIEKAVQELPELDSVTSTSRTGLSTVNVNIQEKYKDLDPIWDELRRKIDAIRDDLPSGAVGPVVNTDFGDVYPIMLSITGDGYTYAELKTVADEVRDKLLRIDEVAKVEIYGAQQERIFVEYNNARLAEVGLSPQQLKSILEARNIIQSGGTVTSGGEDIVLEPTGNFESVKDLEQTLIQLPQQQEVVYLGDLANVYRGYVDPATNKMNTTSVSCLGLSISMIDGGNVILLGEKVRALLQRLPEIYPVGVDFHLDIFQPDLVNRKVNEFVENLLQAITIVMLVMIISLGVRTGLVVATLIPSTMLITLLLMDFFEIGLDQISIASLIIALGMLVDNAIVMSESIMVQMAAGKERLRAAVDSANELRIPLLTSSLTTAAAFLPIILAESGLGEYCASLFKVVTIALLISWGLSITMMPLLCMLFIKIKTKAKGDKYQSRFYQLYRRVLVKALQNRIVFLILIIAIFALAIFGFGFVDQGFIPKNDSARLLVDLDMPLGTAIEVTESVVAQFEKHLKENHMHNDEGQEGFVSWTTYIGSKGGPRYRLAYEPKTKGAEHVSMILSATSRQFIIDAIPVLEQYCTQQFPSMTTTWEAESLGGVGGKPVQVRLSGYDIFTLFSIADKVKSTLIETAGTKNVEDDWGPRTKKIIVNIHQPRARRAGVTSQDVAISLESGFSGFVTTEYREGDKIIPIVLRSVAADRQDIEKLAGLNVYVQSSGKSVPLQQIADTRVAWESSKILRRDRNRTVTVQCDLEPGANAMAIGSDIGSWLAGEIATFPAGYTYEVGGDFEESAKANQSLMDKLPIAGFIILLLLVSQFNSIRRTAIILFTIPLGLIGVAIGLLLTGAQFEFFTMLGVISLAGIIINNAIVLIDRIGIEMNEFGLQPAKAVVHASQQRLRPILLTTATTIGGLLPLWFFGGPLWESMAVAIIFGLMFATALTLGVVPVLYSLLFNVSFKQFSYN
ncbi:MAG: efflux RND transporter permease subunit [Desulfobacteraceae bacterium]|jgi:multidrug efflux pump subunit AcrB